MGSPEPCSSSWWPPGPATPTTRADLVATTYYGLPVALATIEMDGVVTAHLIPTSALWGRAYLPPFPRYGLLGPVGLFGYVRARGTQ